MDQQSNKLEELFRDVFEQETMTPSPNVLRRLRFRLWVSDFLSLKPRKLNIFYTVMVLGGITSAILISKQPGVLFNSEEKQNIVFNEPQEGITGKIDQKSTVADLNDQNSVIENETNKELFAAQFNLESSEGCVPFTVNFNNLSVQAKTYRWDFGDGNFSSKKNPEYTYSKPGTYRASLTITNKEGQKSVYSRDIEVLQKPKAGLEIDFDNSVLEERKILFKNLSTGSDSYRWDFGDNVQSTGKDVSHTYSEYGTYKVKLIAKAENGCSDTTILTNKFIDKNYELSFPTNFRPNTSNPDNNGIYDEAGTESFIFYPKNFGAEHYELKIYAPNGLEVFSTKNIKQGWNGFIKGRIAPAGNYTFKAKGVYPNRKPFALSGSFKVIVEDYYQN